MQVLNFFRPFWSPFGVDLFCFGKKFLVYNLVSRNLKVKYRRSIFGLFWTLLSPMAMAGVYFVVFNHFFKVSVPHYLAFILSGVTFFNFFSQSVTEGMESIVGNWGLASKVPIPLQIFPYVGTVTNLITLALSLPVLFGACLLSQVSLGPSVVLLPFFLGLLFFITYGISLILAIGFILFRDLRHAIGILMQLWFYGTPVLYHPDMIPADFRWILFANPIGSIFVAVREILLDGMWPSKKYLLASSLWAFVIIFFAAFLYKKVAKTVVEQI